MCRFIPNFCPYFLFSFPTFDLLFLIFALLCCIACYIVIFDDDVTDALALLVEFGSSSSEHNQKSAVLVLRNLCFNTAGKSKLLATGRSYILSMCLLCM